MKTCKLHPEREAVKGYRQCPECFQNRKRELQKRYTAKVKSNWEDINLKDMLNDAQRMTIQQLAVRYQIDSKTVHFYLKKNNVSAKPSLKGCGKKLNDMLKNICRIPDMTDACGYIYPNHQRY